MSEICIIVTIVVYLAAMLLVGFAYSKTNNDSADFYLGGRKMGPLVTAMSAEASDMSSWLLMGMPGLAYLTGIASPGWTAIGLALGTWLNWLIVARRLRRYSANLDAITVPQFLSLRFHDQRNLLNALGAVIIIVFFVPYTASGFAACGKLFHSLFGVDYMAAMLVSALVIVGYTILGGFRAVTTTDLIQSMVMSLALIAVLGYGIVVAGGWGAVVENAQSLSGYLTMTASHDAVTGGAASYSLLDIVSTMAWGLGYFGMPHILVRFMAVRDEKEMTKSKATAISWVALSLGFAVFIGILGRAYLPELVNGNNEKVFIEMIKKVFTVEMRAPFVAGLFLCGILAAIMSTADSQLLVSASSVAEDIFKGLLKKDADDKTVMNVSRVTVLVVAVLAYIIAWNPNNTVMGLVSNAWAGLGAAFGPLVVMSLYWKRTNFPGAVAGIVTGALAVIIWDYIPLVGGQTLGKATGLYSLVVGFGLGLIAIIAVSLATKAPSEEMLQEFEDVKANRL